MRCARTMYNANSTAFANANATPSGSPSSRVGEHVDADAREHEREGVPGRAGTERREPITGRNSIAATVRAAADRSRDRSSCSSARRRGQVRGRGASSGGRRRGAPPRLAPDREDRGRARDPEPRDPSERRGRRAAPRTPGRGVEDRAADEVEPAVRAALARGDATPDGSSLAEGRNDGIGAGMARKARTRDAIAYEANLLDAVNRRLLEELQADGRLACGAGASRLDVAAGRRRARAAPRARRCDHGLSRRDRPHGGRVPDHRGRPHPPGAGAAREDPGARARDGRGGGVPPSPARTATC